MNLPLDSDRDRSWGSQAKSDSCLDRKSRARASYPSIISYFSASHCHVTRVAPYMYMLSYCSCLASLYTLFCCCLQEWYSVVAKNDDYFDVYSLGGRPNVVRLCCIRLLLQIKNKGRREIFFAPHTTPARKEGATTKNCVGVTSVRLDFQIQLPYVFTSVFLLVSLQYVVLTSLIFSSDLLDDTCCWHLQAKYVCGAGKESEGRRRREGKKCHFITSSLASSFVIGFLLLYSSQSSSRQTKRPSSWTQESMSSWMPSVQLLLSTACVWEVSTEQQATFRSNIWIQEMSSGRRTSKLFEGNILHFVLDAHFENNAQDDVHDTPVPTFV